MWPVVEKSEYARLQEHRRNRQIYNDLHDIILPKYAAYLKDKQDDDKKVPLILSWPELATSTYLDLVVGEDPEIQTPEGSLPFPELPNAEVLIDRSRYGVGLFEVSQDGIIAQNPETCYIVTSPTNIRKVQCYVFWQQFEQTQAEETHIYVKFTIHWPGKIEHQIKEVTKNGKLGPMLSFADFPQFAGLQVDETGIQDTGVNDFLIVQVDNDLTTERYYGRSDYTPAVISILENLELAFARRAEVLAKFTRPKPMAGLSAFAFDHLLQKWVWKTEDAVIVEPGEPPAQYLTWNAQLGDVEIEIQDLFDQLLFHLKIARVLIAGKEAGRAESGTALRIRMIPTLSKVRKMAQALKTANPLVLSLKSKIDVAQGVEGAMAFEPEEVHIIVKDGIPEDPMAAAQVCQLWDLMGAISLESKLEARGLKEGTEAFQKELDRIRANPPSQVSQTPQGGY